MGTTPVQSSIQQKLQETFQPTHLEILNESHMHNVPANSETHFKVIVVSEQFVGQAPVARHRLVHQTLQSELDGPVHALSVVAKTPQQFAANSTISASPKCRGGDGSLAKP